LDKQGYYTHLSLYVSACGTGKGLFTKAPLRKGEVIATWWPMWETRMKRKEAFKHARAGNHYIMQADDDTYFVSLEPDTTDYINHSCDPNIGLSGPAEFVAMRDIAAGEEITFDYAISESDPCWILRCDCGRPGCRRVIRGTDWKKPELQQKYGPYFSDYIKKKMHWHPARRAWVDAEDFLRQKAQKLVWRIRRLFGRA